MDVCLQFLNQANYDETFIQNIRTGGCTAMIKIQSQCVAKWSPRWKKLLDTVSRWLFFFFGGVVHFEFWSQSQSPVNSIKSFCKSYDNICKETRVAARPLEVYSLLIQPSRFACFVQKSGDNPPFTFYIWLTGIFCYSRNWSRCWKDRPRSLKGNDFLPKNPHIKRK